MIIKDGGGDDYLLSSLELNNKFYAVGNSYKENAATTALLSILDSNGNNEIIEYSMEGKNYGFGTIINHNGNLCIAGTSSNFPEGDVNTAIIIELNEELEELSKYTIPLPENFNNGCGITSMVFYENDIFLTGNYMEGVILYGFSLKYSITEDDYDIITYRDHSRALQVLLSNNNSVYVMGIDLFDEINYTMIEIYEYDFQLQEINTYAIANKYTDYAYMKKYNDKYILGASIDEDKNKSSNQHLELSYLDENFYPTYSNMLGEYGTWEYVALRKSFDFIDPNLIFYAYQSDYQIGFEPPWYPSPLVVGYVDSSFSVYGDHVFGDKNDNFRPNYVLATSDGGCLVVGRYYDIINAPDNCDIFMFKLNPEDLVLPTDHNAGLDKHVQISPNPFRGVFTIELGFEVRNAKLRILDCCGRQVYSTSISGKACEIRSTNWARGVYVYQIFENNSLIDSGKLIKQ